MTLVDRSLRRQFTAAMALAMALALLLSGTALAQTTADEVAAVAIDDACNDVPEDGFPDVPESNTFDDEIECLKAYEITIGKSDGTYDPSGKVPRWQMALFIYRLAQIADEQLDELELPAPSPEDSTFTDLDGVDPDAIDAIDVLNEIGVVEGTTATTYEPYKNIRRDQMASFINRLQGAIQAALGGDPEGFTTGEDFFPDDGDNVHEDNINGLASVGIVQGKVDGDYDPAERVNRGQMSAFIMRHVEVNIDDGVLESLYPGSQLDGRTGVVSDVSQVGANNQYKFVENGTDEEVTVDYEPGDDFFVDGDPASEALFEADIDEGDVVEWEEREDGPDAHALTNTEVESGFIGAFDTGASTITVINTVTGDEVDTFTYAATDLFTVDGDPATEAAFEAELNEGDTIEVDDLGEDPQTFNLTNGTLSGTVDAVGVNTVDVELSAGAVVEDVATNLADSYMVDGEASNLDGFDDDVSVGDSVTYKDEGDIETWTLVNMAPSTQTGLAVTDDLTDDAFIIVDSGGPIDIDYGAALPTGTENRFFVDGEGVLQADFEGDYSAGDSISFTEADGDTDQNRVIALTNELLRGMPDVVDTGANTFEVLGPDEENDLASVDYTGDDLEVNGSDVDEATFEAYLVAVEDGVIDGYVEVDLDDDDFNVVVED